MEEIINIFRQGLGIDAESLTVGQMAVRAVIVYFSALMMVRIGEKRFLAKNTAFDVILGIIFGSVVSRAINGSAEFVPTLAAGFVLVLLHWLFAVLSFHLDWFGTVVKGNARVLVENGAILWEAMRKSHISRKDLMSAVRLQANITTLDRVDKARLERSGDISVIKSNGEPKLIEVEVVDGVQTIRIQLE